MPLRVMVLQHIACEPPGVYEDVMRERGASILRVELDEGDQLPDRSRFDDIVAMGGPMSVNDDAVHPWLTDEKRLSGTPSEVACPISAPVSVCSCSRRAWERPSTPGRRRRSG